MNNFQLICRFTRNEDVNLYLANKTVFKIIELNYIPNTKHKKLQLSSERHVGKLHCI